MRSVKIFGREPAVWLALIAAALKLVGAFWVGLGPDQQAWINAVLAAAMGLAIAFIVHDGVVAAVLGLAQAILSLAVGYGLDWSADQQAVVMAFVTMVAGAFDRTQVTAPVGPPQSEGQA
jgi:hypothetical protein